MAIENRGNVYLQTAEESPFLFWQGVSRGISAAYFQAGGELGIPVVVRDQYVHPDNYFDASDTEQFDLRIFTVDATKLSQLSNRVAEIMENNNQR